FAGGQGSPQLFERASAPNLFFVDRLELQRIQGFISFHHGGSLCNKFPAWRVDYGSGTLSRRPASEQYRSKGVWPCVTSLPSSPSCVSPRASRLPDPTIVTEGRSSGGKFVSSKIAVPSGRSSSVSRLVRPHRSASRRRCRTCACSV